MTIGWLGRRYHWWTCALWWGPRDGSYLPVRAVKLGPLSVAWYQFEGRWRPYVAFLGWDPLYDGVARALVRGR